MEKFKQKNMDTTLKIAIVVAIIGLIGVFLNILFAAPFDKIKYHLYSSIPGIGAALYIVFYFIIKIIGNL